MEVDNETKIELSDTEQVRLMTDTPGWGIVKRDLDLLILDLQNINNLDFTTEQSVMFDLKARKMASEILFGWLKKNVYGRIEQATTAQQALADQSPSLQFVDRG